jgi:hypothetical protein
MPNVYNLVYQLSLPFSGAPGQVTNTVAMTVSVTPSGVRQPPYVVPQGGPGGVAVCGNVVMNISIIDGPGGNNTLYPLGLAVQYAGVRTRPSPAIFPLATVSPSTPTIITLGDNSSLDTPANNYEFVVLFQDINGNFGTLDPRIANDES